MMTSNGFRAACFHSDLVSRSAAASQMSNVSESSPLTASCRVSALRVRLVSNVLYGGSNNMRFHVNTSLPAVEALSSEAGSSCNARGPDAAKYLAYRNFGMRAGAGQRGKLPVIQPIGKPTDWTTFVSGCIVGGSPNLTSEVRLEPESNDLDKDICGRHFIFDKPCARLERTRTVIPQLSRDYHVHRPGNLHPFSHPSKELSHSHSERPVTLGYHKRYELNTTPAILLPSTLVLNGRNTFTVENCKLSKPLVKYPITSNPLNVKDHQKSQSYPDPVVGASRSFIHRVCELSSLEGEAVRQEKLKKMRKLKKPPS